MAYAMLGDIQFELLTGFTRMDGMFATNFAEHSLIDGKPRLQFIGDALDEYSFQLRLHALFCDPAAELEKLRAAQRQHTALPFMLGSGEYKGDFVIVKLSVNTEATNGAGILLSAIVSIEIKEFISDFAVKPNALALIRAGVPLPPGVKTLVADKAKPNLPFTSLKEAVGASRAMIGAFKSAKDIVSAARQFSKNPALVFQRLSSAMPYMSNLAKAAEKMGVNVSALPALTEFRPLIVNAGRVVTEAESAIRALNGVSGSNALGRLYTLTGNVEVIGEQVRLATPLLTKAAVRVVTRESI